MLKFMIILLGLQLYLFSTNINIEALQQEFKKSVIETNIFRKRFDKYLTNNCQNDFECLSSYINRLKQWDTVQNDDMFQNMLKEKYEITTLDPEYWEKVKKKLHSKKLDLKESQFLSVIDLEKQYIILTIWDEVKQTFHYIGKDLISSGNMEREKEIKYGENHYLKTPSGIFKAEIGWRSDGKLNKDNITLGYGHKDRYIFYFGKHQSIRYHTFDKERKKIKDQEKWKLITDEIDLAMHAHKSTKPLGEPYSHGCIRTSDELNRFMDNNLVLHKNLFEGERWLHKYSKAPEYPKNHHIAGEYLIVFDSI